MSLVLPTKPKLKKKNPRSLLIYGRTKVGKTSMLAELENNLIIDTELGTDFISGLAVNVASLSDLAEVYKTLKEKNPYSYISLDTIDEIVNWFEERTVRENKVDYIGDLEYGKGYSIVRDAFLGLKRKFEGLGLPLILSGHRKRSIVGEDNVQVDSKTLDLPGKLKRMLMADCDAIGYVFRDEENKLKISFQTGDTTDIDCGSRCEHLAGKVLDFKWENIFIK